LVAALHPARKPGKELDEVENAGTRAVAIPPRPHLGDPAPQGRSRLATAFSAVDPVHTLNIGIILASSSPAYRASEPDEVEALHKLVLASLDDDQAVDTISIPLAGKSSIADHMVIASGRSTRQVASMASKLAEKIKGELGRSTRIEGLPTADWVLIDAGDVIVHLFRPEVRSFYNLERMWAFGDAPVAAVDAQA
jgi:ribosome-associated protein